MVCFYFFWFRSFLFFCIVCCKAFCLLRQHEPDLDFLSLLHYRCQSSHVKNAKLIESIYEVSLWPKILHPSCTNRITHFCLETLKGWKVEIGLFLLYRLTMAFVIWIFLINIERFKCDIWLYYYFNRAAKIKNDLPHPVITAINTWNFYSHLDSDEVSKVSDKFLKNVA